ncbi:MAG TPA: NADH-quinone oxidoreductase subunit N [Phycisphaerae bacterium]|nr:NADH-quinone oxidoreductase subunit N [Phycisphaerae bacterium]
MDLSAYFPGFLPELVMVVGACAVLLLGAPARAAVPGDMSKQAPGMLAIIVTFTALIISLWLGHPASEAACPPGLMASDLLYYVRIGGLGVGVILLFANLHLPVANERAEFFSMILFSLTGLLITAAANDLLVLFFAIELVSVPTYILVALTREDKRASEASVKYFFLGAMAAAIMVYGFSFLYGALGGSTTIAGPDSMTSAAASTNTNTALIVAGLLLSFAGVFFKLAAVPFHSYVADVYEGASSTISGLLGFLPKFAGLVAAVKLLSIFAWDVPPQVLWVLWIVAAVTMTVGNTIALLQRNVKRILAYSSVAHSGYMMIGLIVGPSLLAGAGPMRDGVSAMLFYMVIYGAMNLGAFAVLGTLAKSGESVEDIADIEGLHQRHPGLALAMALCIFSLMGFPPTAGLLGKVYVFSSAFSVGADHPFGGPLVVLAVIGVINSAIGAAYYLRIVAACYNRESRTETQVVGGPALRLAVVVCSGLMLLLFIKPSLISRDAKSAAATVVTKQVVTKNLARASVTPQVAEPDSATP